MYLYTLTCPWHAFIQQYAQKLLIWALKLKNFPRHVFCWQGAGVFSPTAPHPSHSHTHSCSSHHITYWFPSVNIMTHLLTSNRISYEYSEQNWTLLSFSSYSLLDISSVSACDVARPSFYEWVLRMSKWMFIECFYIIVPSILLYYITDFYI